jgi:hypothetical protein
MRFLASFALAVTLNAHAQGDEPAYAILSLVGDRLTLVAHTQQTGTSFGSERHSTVKVAGPALEKSVLFAADTAVRAGAPQAKTTLLLTQSPEIYESQMGLVDPDVTIEPMLPAVMPLVSPSKATHLILVTKVRYDAQVVIRTGNVAFGKLDGIGFYIDTDRPMRNVQTGEEYRGLIAPYAHFRASLIDLRSNRLVKQEIVHVAAILPATAGIGAWDDIPPQQKIAALTALVGQEVQRAVGHLLESTGQY